MNKTPPITSIPRGTGAVKAAISKTEAVVLASIAEAE